MLGSGSKAITGDMGTCTDGQSEQLDAWSSCCTAHASLPGCAASSRLIAAAQSAYLQQCPCMRAQRRVGGLCCAVLCCLWVDTVEAAGCATGLA
jgi:hypothetical protein